MKLKIWHILILVIVLIAFIDQCTQVDDEKFRERINQLEKLNDSLRKDSELKLLLIQNLNDSIKIKESLLSEYHLRIDSLKTKRNEIPDIVDNFNDFELDSILTNYRHPNRN